MGRRRPNRLRDLALGLSTADAMAGAASARPLITVCSVICLPVGIKAVPVEALDLKNRVRNLLLLSYLELQPLGLLRQAASRSRLVANGSDVEDEGSLS